MPQNHFMKINIYIVAIIGLVLLFSQFAVFAPAAEKPPLLEKYAKKFKANIYPVVNKNKQWELVDYSGNRINDKIYSAVIAIPFHDEYLIIASKKNTYYMIAQNGIESALKIPKGFSIVAAPTSQKHIIFLIDDKKKSSSFFPYRMYDLNKNTFITDYIGMPTIASDIICGTKPENNNTDQTELVVFRKDDAGNYHSTILSNYSRGAALGSYIAAEKKGKENRGRAEILDLNLNLVLMPSEDYAFGWIPVHEDKIATVFMVPGQPNTRGFTDAPSGRIIAKGYKGVQPYYEGLARVQCENNKFGFIDPQGAKKIDCQYLRATRFSNGLAFVSNDEGKIFTIDKTGNNAFDLSFEFRHVWEIGSLIYGVLLHENDSIQEYPLPQGAPQVDIRLKNVEGQTIWSTNSQKEYDMMRSCPLYTRSFIMN